MSTARPPIVVQQLIGWLWEIATALGFEIPDETARSGITTFEQAAATIASSGVVMHEDEHEVLGKFTIMLKYDELVGLVCVITGETFLGSIQINTQDGALSLIFCSLGEATITSIKINSQSELIEAELVNPRGQTNLSSCPLCNLGALYLLDLLYKNMPSLRRALRASRDDGTTKVLTTLQTYWERCLGPELSRELRYYATRHHESRFQLLANATQAGFSGITNGEFLIACGIFFTLLPTPDWFDPSLPQPDAETYRKWARVTGEYMESQWGCLIGRSIHWIRFIFTLGRYPRPRDARYYSRNLLRLVGVK